MPGHSARLDEWAYVLPLIDGVHETPMWRNFLERLRADIGADFVVLNFLPPGKPRSDSLVLTAGQASLEQIQAYNRQYLPPIAAMDETAAPEGVPVSLARMLELDHGRRADFFRDLTRVQGIGALYQMRVREASGVDAWLTIVRQGEDFGAEALDLMSRIAPILRGVLRNFIARENERFEAALTAEAIHRLQVGWLVLDASGCVVDADGIGRFLLSSIEVIGTDARNRLIVQSPEAERELRQAIDAMSVDPHTRPRAIYLRSDPWLDMLLVPARNRILPSGPTPVAIAYVHSDDWGSEERGRQLVDLFGLRPSEARLAIAICRGCTVAEAAAVHGLTIETARSYLKAIYAKTGARGLPDLVRIMMSSVLALAPGTST